MAQTTVNLTQSKYFTPVFNAAIFDGPFRIYFSQVHEAQALKVYFHLQQQVVEGQPALCDALRDQGRNIFVMMYPNKETFELSFDVEGIESSAYQCRALGQDLVLGLPTPADDDGDSFDVYTRLEGLLRAQDLSFAEEPVPPQKSYA